MEWKEFIAIKTGHPDFWQIYEFNREDGANSLIYDNYTPFTIYRTKAAVDAAVDKLNGESDAKTHLHRI